MKNTNPEDSSSRSSVPLMAWEFHCEYLKELKAILTDLKKVKKIATQFAWKDKNLKIKERIQEEVVVVTDLDLKIIFASNGLRKMTGYKEEEVLGKTPKLFQGPETSKEILAEIREAIKLQVPFEKTLENYKKNGETYNCKINGFPVYNSKGKVSHFIAFEKLDLTA